jgi:dihydroorotase
MSFELLIKNGRVIDPANGVDKKCDVLIVDGKIAEVGEKTQDPRLKTQDCKVIDAVGKLVTPGLIDVHVHFREPKKKQ